MLNDLGKLTAKLAAFGSYLLFLAFSSGWVNAQPLELPVRYGLAQPVRVDGMEYTLDALILKPLTGSVALGVSLSMRNIGTQTTGVFVFAPGTGALSDTGIAFNGPVVNGVGITICNSDRRGCARSIDQYGTDLSPGLSDDAQFDIYTLAVNPNKDGSLIARTAAANLTLIIYAQTFDGKGGFIPITFHNVRLQNIVQ